MQVALGALPLVLLVELAVTAWNLRPLATEHGVAFLRDVLTTYWGVLWMLRGVALLWIMCCRLGSRLQVAATCAWLLARSFQGHAGAHGTVPAIIDGAHLFAAGAWLGSLVQLSLLSDGAVVAAMPRLRRLIAVAVAVLLSAGLYGALLHIPTVDALLHSAYGQVLMIKLALVAPLIVLGASNRLQRLPAVVIGRHAAPQRVRATVRREIALGALVLLLSALLGRLPMPHPPPG